LVPTFELGRKSGLGIAIQDADLTSTNALAPAWSLTPSPPLAVELPVYYHWEFRSGQAGDFESLARRLTPGVPLGLAKRTIDVSQPGFPAASATTQDMGVAAPVFGRLHQPAGPSLLSAQLSSQLPVAATRSAMRRIGRQRGPLTRRLAAHGFTRVA